MTLRRIIRYADIREDSRIKDYRRGKRDLLWYQSEAVELDLYIQEGGAPKAITEGAAVNLEAWSGSDTETLYIDKAGSVISANGGHVRISLTAGQANLPAGSYFIVVRIAADGIGLYGIATVVAAPNTEAVSYVGTSSPFASAQLVRDVDWTATGNTDVTLPSEDWAVTDIFLWSPEECSGAEWSIGPDDDPDGIYSGTEFDGFKALGMTRRITTGTLRLAITAAGSAGAAGKLCIRGFDIS